MNFDSTKMIVEGCDLCGEMHEVSGMEELYRRELDEAWRNRLAFFRGALFAIGVALAGVALLYMVVSALYPAI